MKNRYPVVPIFHKFSHCWIIPSKFASLLAALRYKLHKLHKFSDRRLFVCSTGKYNPIYLQYSLALKIVLGQTLYIFLDLGVPPPIPPNKPVVPPKRDAGDRKPSIGSTATVSSPIVRTSPVTGMVQRVNPTSSASGTTGTDPPS